MLASPMVAAFCHRFPLAALAVVFSWCALLLTACAGEPSTLLDTRAPDLTLPPAATRIPTPAPATPTLYPTPLPSSTPMPTPAPATPTPYPAPTLTPGASDNRLRPSESRFVTAPNQEGCPEHGYCDLLEIGGQLTAAAWLDDERMYLVDYEGRVLLLNVKTGEIRTALTGLSIPQGLTVLNDHLYVSDMGNVCKLLGTANCKENATWTRREYLDFVKQASVRILSYPIDGNGDLGLPKVVVDRIPSDGRDHSANGLTSDGEWIYASIGHIASSRKHLALVAEAIAAGGGRADMLGAIVRFRPPSSEVEVYANGIRNVYGISIGPDGTIYGADNDRQDGLADCCHREELNAIVEGGFYGFPFYGTNEAPPEAGVVEPVAVLAGTASTFAYANSDGVYVAYLALDGSDDGFVVDRFDYDTWTPERIFRGRSHITTILERRGLLYLVSFDGVIHVINPAAGPVNARPSRFHTDGYVTEVIAAGVPAVIPPGYEVYIDGNRLIYAKDPCAAADTEASFFLHVFPVNDDDLPEGRRQHGSANLDFSFDAYGWRSGDSCYAVRELPGYAISSIRTGQYVEDGDGHGRTWEAEHHFGR